ncbi:hypothetical protein M885DRAFT_530841 [Pelagophyceae sp. CCMP2097]|nr:hypothetical protein M885DRAFT_530841 [Pelagophyceae sp. CCMP2097]
MSARCGRRAPVLTAAERLMLQDTWPLDLLQDDARAPLECADAEDFIMRALLGDHLDDVVILRNGGAQLGLDEEAGLPAWFRAALEVRGDDSSAPSVLEVLRRICAEAPDKARLHKATVEFVDSGVQREAKKALSATLNREGRSAASSPRGTRPASPNRETPALRASTQHVPSNPAPPEDRPPRRASPSSSDSIAKVSKDEARDDSRPRGGERRASRSRSRSRSCSLSLTREERDALKDLHSSLAAAASCVALGKARESDLYVTELRRLRCFPNPRGREAAWPRAGRAPATAVLGERFTKSLLGLQAADAFGDLARWTLSWDTRDDGVFVGGRGAGKGLHVDQVYWSNIGHNWRGHKLLASWPAGETSSELHTTMLDRVFSPPLDGAMRAALATASRVVLLRPGDVFVMSGGVAHTTLAISDDALNVTSYESIVTLAPAHARHFLRTGARTGPFALPRGGMPSAEVREFKEAIVEALDFLTGAPRIDFRTTRFRLSRPAQIAVETVLREQLVACIRVLSENDEFFAGNLSPRLKKAAARLLAAPLSSSNFA